MTLNGSPYSSKSIGKMYLHSKFGLVHIASEMNLSVREMYVLYRGPGWQLFGQQGGGEGRRGRGEGRGPGNRLKKGQRADVQVSQSLQRLLAIMYAQLRTPLKPP